MEISEDKVLSKDFLENLRVNRFQYGLLSGDIFARFP